MPTHFTTIMDLMEAIAACPTSMLCSISPEIKFRSAMSRISARKFFSQMRATLSQLAIGLEQYESKLSHGFLLPGNLGAS